MPKIIKLLFIILIVSGLISFLLHYSSAMPANEDKFNIFYYLIILTLLSSGIILRFRSNMSSSLQQFALWITAFLALILLYSFRNDFLVLKERIISELMPSRASITKNGTLEFRMSSDNHFRINMIINNVPARFLVDTGATDVVIPPHLAKKLGYEISKLQFNKIYNTANGQGRGASINITTMQIGDFKFNNINASVNEAEMDSPLLGMSFLSKLSSYKVENDILIIKP